MKFLYLTMLAAVVDLMASATLLADSSLLIILFSIVPGSPHCGRRCRHFQKRWLTSTSNYSTEKIVINVSALFQWRIQDF